MIDGGHSVKAKIRLFVSRSGGGLTGSDGLNRQSCPVMELAACQAEDETSEQLQNLSQLLSALLLMKTLI